VSYLRQHDIGVSTAPFAEVYLARDGSDHVAEGPALLGHSLDDGTFAVDDEVAKDATRCICRAPFVLPADFDDAQTAVACARIRRRTSRVDDAMVEDAAA
jgi:hypothetical protein